MQLGKLIGIILGVVALILIIYGGIYVYSMTQVSAQGIENVSVSAISLTGCTIRGEVVVRNDGILAVNVKDIRYVIQLNANGEQIGAGASPGGKIRPGETRSFPLETAVSWKPTLSLARELLLGGDARATINGAVTVAELGPLDIRIPVTQTVDLQPYVQQFVQGLVQRAVDAIIG